MLILVWFVYMLGGGWIKIDPYLIWLMSSSFDTGKYAWLKPSHTHYRRFNAFSSCPPQHQQEIGTVVVLLGKSEAQQFWEWRKIRVWPSCVQFTSWFLFFRVEKNCSSVDAVLTCWIIRHWNRPSHPQSLSHLISYMPNEYFQLHKSSLE